MPRYSVIPSLFQVNEGDSITTALISDLPVGSKLYYKVVGTKVTAGDFSSGGISGSVKVGAGGVASILHKLKADKATEGEESFTIQIFSDKKMKMLVGESDVVRVADTSIKATKSSANSTEPFSAPQLQMNIGSITLKSDVIYGKNSDIFRLYTNGLSKVQVDLITGFGYEVELSPSQIVVTEQYIVPQPFTSDNGSIYLTGTRRYIKNGIFNYQNGKLSTDLSQDNYESFVEGANREAPLGTLFYNSQTSSTYENYSTEQYIFNDRLQITSQPKYFYDMRNNGENLGDPNVLSWFRSYGGGKFFGENWWSNPFTSNLI